MPLLLAALCLCAAGAPTLAFDPDAGRTGAVEVHGLTRDQLGRLEDAAKTTGWPAILSLRLAAADADSPAMLGTHAVDGDLLRFTPRFPLRPGQEYRATFAPAAAGLRSLKPLDAAVSLPARPESPRAAVEHVYPSREILPENQLKFYLHFTRPMSQGDSYRHIRLLDAGGRAIELPFLELGEELWDETGARLTVFIDPGRIKRGLKPREEVGPVFEEGQSYTLVVAADWPDADGRPLAREHRKPIRIAAPDERQPDTARWTVDAPRAGSADSVTIRFDEPLDHAMLRRVIRVVAPDGRPVAGTVEIDREETRWRFTPETTWPAGRHELRVETTLEDLAGNSLARPFELDVFHPIERQTAPESTSIPFNVTAP